MAAYTIDASVFVNSANPGEEHHEESLRFLAWIRDQAEPVIVPTLLLPEIAAALARAKRGKAGLALRFAEAVSRLPYLHLIGLDEVLARRAARAAAELRLRGSDAVYAAVALRFAATLVSLDREQRERVTPLLMAYTPGEVLARSLPERATSPTPS